MDEIISIDDFKKVAITVGEIKSAEPVEGSDKLLKLVVDFGTETRQVLSGIAAHFPEPSTLVGKRVPFITNLKPRSMMGLESQAMLLATNGSDGTFSLFETHVPPGSRVG